MTEQFEASRQPSKMAIPFPEDFALPPPLTTGDAYRTAVRRAFEALPPFVADGPVPTPAEAFKDAVVLVVGDTLLARALVKALSKMDVAELHALVPAGSDYSANAPKNVRVHEFNIFSQITRLELPKYVHYVFNAHELASDWAKPDFFAEENTNVARAVFKLCAGWRDCGCLRRLVHFSTSEVYGYPQQPPTEAELPSDYGYPYASSKILAELSLAKHMEMGVAATLLRIGPVYGAGEGSGNEVTSAIARMEKGWRVLISSGSNDVGLIHVDDAVSAALLAAAAPHAKTQIYNLSGDSRVTWSEFYGVFEANLCPAPTSSLPAFIASWLAYFIELIYWLFFGYRKTPLLTLRRVYRESVDGDLPNWRAKRELGFVPKVDWKEGVQEAAAWIKEGKDKKGSKKKN